MFDHYGLKELYEDRPKHVNSDVVHILIHKNFGVGKGYSSKIKQLAKETKNPIISFEYMVEPSMKVIEHLEPLGRRYFISTINGNTPQPDIGWDKASEIINSFNPKKVILVGSNLYVGKKGNLGECVGIAYSNLKNKVPGLEIDKKYCCIVHD